MHLSSQPFYSEQREQSVCLHASASSEKKSCHQIETSKRNDSFRKDSPSKFKKSHLSMSKISEDQNKSKNLKKSKQPPRISHCYPIVLPNDDKLLQKLQ